MYDETGDQAYMRAQRAGMRYVKSVPAGQDPYLPALSELVP